MNDLTGAGEIPKLIHRIWLGGSRPVRRYALPVASFGRVLRDHRPVFWDEKKCVSFLKGSFPKHLAAFRALSSYAAKSDLMRYLILARYGGFYSDYDVVLINGRALKRYLAGRPSCIFFTEAVLGGKFRAATSRIGVRGGIPEDRIRIANFFMGACPGHPILDGVIREMDARLKQLRCRIREPYDVIYMTGPDVVSTVYHRGHEGVVRVPLARSRAMLFHQGHGKWAGWKSALSKRRTS